jgi:hypothetical protein
MHANAVPKVVAVGSKNPLQEILFIQGQQFLAG